MLKLGVVVGCQESISDLLLVVAAQQPRVSGRIYMAPIFMEIFPDEF
jgi:hypothetical protein